MRILLLTAAFFVITICVAQVTPPYSTSFEGAEGTLNDNFPDGWIWEDLNTEPFSNQSWQIIKNTASVTNARTDSTAAHMFSHSSETNNDWLYTPGVQLQGGVSYNISFWYSVASVFASTERLSLKVGYAPIALAMTENLWSDISIDNQAYQQAIATYAPVNDETVYFAFHYFSEELQFILLLDDVNITFDGASINERQVGNWSIWPADGHLTIASDRPVNGQHLAVIDASGRSILDLRLTQERSTVPIHSLAAGVYIATVRDVGGVLRSRRFVVGG